MPANRLPTLAIDAQDPPTLDVATCPQCRRRPLRFGTDQIGYAIESCPCGYRDRIGHRPAPTLASVAPAHRATRPTAKGDLVAQVLAALPAMPGEAKSARRVSVETGIAMNKVTSTLRNLLLQDRVRRRTVPREDRMGPPTIGIYWRAA